MPSINDLKIKKNKKFEKQEFRPWDGFPKTETLESNEALDVINEKKLELNKSHDKKLSSVSTKELEGDSPDHSLSAENLRKIRRRLYGPQKQVLAFLLDNVEFKEGDKLYLKPMVYVDVAEELQITLSNLKSIINKFKKDNLISLDDYKPGKGGYGCFLMEDSIHSFFSTESL